MIGLIPALVAAAGLGYEVTASEGARELAIEARIAAFPDRDGELSVDDGAEPFVRDVQLVSATGAVPIERRGDSWFAPDCALRGCPSVTASRCARRPRRATTMTWRLCSGRSSNRLRVRGSCDRCALLPEPSWS